MLLRAVFGAMLLLAGPVQAGTVLKTLTRDLAKNGETVATTYAQQGNLRVETGRGSGAIIIFKNDILYTLDPQQKTYVMIDQPTMQRVVQQVQEALAKIPPELRAQLDKMAGGSQGPVKVRKTTRSDKVAGYACTYSEVLRGEVLVTEACVAALSALKGSQELVDASAKATAFMQQLTQGVDAPWMRQFVDRELDNYGELGGIPVRARRFGDGKALFETTLQSIGSQALAADLFEVPAGYTRKELPTLR